MADRFCLPTAKQIDARIVLGPALFGVGWGLSGFCPGPAVTSLPLMASGTLIFVPAMIVGMVFARLLSQRLAARTVTTDPAD
jgi:uncharacterized membrane protein YedE/YeeE